MRPKRSNNNDYHTPSSKCWCGADDSSAMVECGLCNTFIHYRCLGLSLSDLDDLITDKPSKYVCKECVPSLDSNTEKQFSAHSTHKRVFVFRPEGVASAVAPQAQSPVPTGGFPLDFFQNLMSECVKAATKAATEVVTEILQQRDKKNNLVIVGWPENENSDGKQQDADMNKIESYFTQLNIPTSSVQSVFRDGYKSKDRFERIIKLCFKDRHVDPRRQFLFKANGIMKSDPAFTGSRFTPFVREDLTFQHATASVPAARRAQGLSRGRGEGSRHPGEPHYQKAGQGVQVRTDQRSGTGAEK